MRATDVMTRNVITISPDANVSDAVRLLAEHDVSALPVVDAEDRVIGIVSEADLIHRLQDDAEKKNIWWMEAVTPTAALAKDFARIHGQKIHEIMTTEIFSATEETPLSSLAALLEKKRIKRVPILQDGKLVGIVSRTNLLQALAVGRSAEDTTQANDRAIRLDLMARLAGLTLESREGGWNHQPLTGASPAHVSVWRKPPT